MTESTFKVSNAINIKVVWDLAQKGLYSPFKVDLNMFAKVTPRVPSVRIGQVRGFRTSTVTRTKAAATFNKHLQTQLKEIQEAGTYKKERVILSPQSSEIEVVNPSTGKKVKVLNFWYVVHHIDSVFFFSTSFLSKMGIMITSSNCTQHKKLIIQVPIITLVWRIIPA